MNQKTPYELQIADKLQQLPLPDLEDAIWARIERTLDIDLPTDDSGPGDGGPSTPWWDGSGLGGFVFSMVFVAALTTFVLYKTLNPSNHTPAPSNTPTTEQALPSQDYAQPPPGTTVLPRNRTPVRANSPAPVVGDSALAQPVVITPPPLGDTAAATTVLVAPPTTLVPQPSADSTQPSRRRRGAQGITPGDYRIVPKRNSSGQ